MSMVGPNPDHNPNPLRSDAVITKTACGPSNLTRQNEALSK